MAKKCKVFCFFVANEKGIANDFAEKLGRTEFLAPDYPSFKKWVHGIDALIKWKKSLSSFARRLNNTN